MGQITNANYINYLGKTNTHAKAYHASTFYPTEGNTDNEILPSVQACYGVYDSLLTAHKTLCAFFGGISNPTANTACPSIPRAFTIAIGDNNSIIEYQYKKAKPQNGYTMYDLEKKFVSDVDAGNIEYSHSSSYQNGTIGKALKSAEENIDAIDENISYLQGDIITPRHFGAVGDGVHDDKPAFIAAINTLAEGDTLYIPDGIYLCVDLDITKPIRIVGESKEKTIIYNNTSGKPCFKSTINHLEISNLQFKAIPHNTPGIDRTTNPYEVNNGRSGLLYKGEYGTFHDIIGDYIRTIIWLGGDFLPLGITKKGNTVYNITCRKVFCGVLGCQQENCTISNVSGSFYNFRDWDWSREDGGFAYDDTDFYMGLNPSHLVYITVRPVRRSGTYEDTEIPPISEIFDGEHSWSKNISITNIHSVSGSEADEHASATISAKGIIGGEISNVTSVNAASVWAYSLKNFTIHNIVCLHNKSYRHALLCEDDRNMIPASKRTGGRPPQYNCIIDTVICSGGVATFRAATNAVCKIKNMVLDMDDELDGDTLHSVYGLGYQFALYGAYWVEIDGLRITNTNSQLPAETKKEQGIYAYGGVALGDSTLGYLRDSIVNMANGLPYVGGANASFELNNCTPNHPSVPLNPTSNKMYELTPQAEVDRNILRENDIVAGETFLTYTSTDDKQVIVTPLLLYGRKEQHFKLLVTNKGTQAIPVRCSTDSWTPEQNPNFDYVRTSVPIDCRVLEVNDTFEYEVWRKDRVITVIFNGNESPFAQLHGTHHDEVWADTTYNIHLTSENNTLTFGTIPISQYETTIYLTIDDGTNSVINLPTSYEYIGIVAFEDGKNYVITIKNGIITSNEVLTGPVTPEPEPVIENNDNT